MHGSILPLRGVRSLTFRRICYPPESNIRIFNPQYPAVQPPRKRGVEAHPGPLEGREPDTHPQPLPKGGGQGTSTYPFRRICYPITSPLTILVNYPLPWGNRRSRFACRRKATGSCSCKRTKFERASLARVIDEVASLAPHSSFVYSFAPLGRMLIAFSPPRRCLGLTDCWPFGPYLSRVYWPRSGRICSGGYVIR